jgi:hypothetical protein
MMKTKLIFSTLVILVGFAFFIEVGITFLGGEKYKVVQTQPNTLGFEDYLAQGSCTEPTEGCGMNHYFDTVSCECVYSYSCNEPTEGCGENSYFDATNCECVHYQDPNTCNLEPSDCGANEYVDYNSCSCFPYDTCTEPSGGCGNDRYWDASLCNCKTYDDSSGCGLQPSDCGANEYVDYNSCLCVFYDDTTEPIGGYNDTSPETYNNSTDNFDRLAYEPQSRVECVKSILTSEEYQKLRYFMPSTSQEYDEIEYLGKKVESCWGESKKHTSDDSYGSDSGYSTTYLENEKCLMDGLGEHAYREIYQGTREPTYEEHLWFEKCYGNMV